MENNNKQLEKILQIKLLNVINQLTENINTDSNINEKRETLKHLFKSVDYYKDLLFTVNKEY